MNIKRFIGIRVIKTAIAVIVSITLASWIGLKNPNSAGLLSILGIEVTKRKGLRSAFARISASILGLLVASALFSMLGFHVWVISLFVLVVFPILHRLRLSDGAVTGSVTMFHLYLAQTITAELVLNEILLLFVGLGSATLINIMYFPKNDEMIRAYKSKLEQLYASIFLHIAEHLKDETVVWDGSELLEASRLVEEGAYKVSHSLENSLVFGQDAYVYWQMYFYMRREQLESIQRMLGLVAQVSRTIPQGKACPLFLKNLVKM
ncbi:aromatic acid exporter family protein [Paenibacillus larvae]|nr:aromatic acid exporter family protein [Paenibacillus larvae]MDT2258343.1 aromatic acid exporter family protein [Paenibacillus larvae]